MNDNRIYLLTGAAGFLGSNICLQLQKKGCKAMGHGATDIYRKIEDGVVGTYQKIEDGVVGAYRKVEDRFVGQFLTREGESVEEAKARLRRQEQK